MATTSVLVTPFHPFPSFSLRLPSNTLLSTLPSLFAPLLPVTSQSLSTRSGRSIDQTSNGTVGDVGGDGPFMEVRLVPKMLGGKGGFGSQLRAAGGRMSSKKTSNNDSCRDLNGRRLSTIKEAQKLAASIASEPERQAAARKQAADRLAELNTEIARLDTLVNGDATGNAASGSESKKRRLNDSEQVEKAREGVEKVRGAVAAAMLKKRKKNKASAAAAAQSLAAVEEEQGKTMETPATLVAAV